MQNPSTFRVYNASAGSGKTFTLVKEYLKILLQSEDIFRFQKVLAITFTNKASSEMKERILECLDEFSKGIENKYLPQILKETSLDTVTIKERSAKVLNAILRNYTAFSITTIDSFTHKLIKSFAYDLGLSVNFEVELDATELLSKSVDILISKIGTEEKLTKILIDFSLTKTDNDTSWDISRELNEFSKLLLNENDAKHFQKLADKSLTDFLDLKQKLEHSSLQIQNSFSEIGSTAIATIENNNLKFSDFAYSGECPKHFQKLINFKYQRPDDFKFEGRINTVFQEDKNLFAGKTDKQTKEAINAIQPRLKELYFESKKLFQKTIGLYTFNKLALNSIIPLTVLNNINSELNKLKSENNIRLNAEFNQLISENIKNQPYPFIYERIGQRFMHYFIDEMQDTSVLQWENLIPLIDNTLAQENSSLLLVGDGKQAIYRWRGGKAEQFIKLGKNTNPFQPAKQIATLDTNYRSYSEIVKFNNSFFQHVSNFLHNDSYKKLFLEGNKQLENEKIGGTISITFLEKEEDKELQEIRYAKKVLSKIIELKKEFSLQEICILVRTRKDGIKTANYLSENQISVVSSETLLLSNSTKVNFIIAILKAVSNPSDKEILFDFLYFLYGHLNIVSDKHEFLNEFSNQSLSEIFKRLNQYGTSFTLLDFQKLPLYEKAEAIIQGFNLLRSSDAYVQYFLNIILERQQKGADLSTFIEFWETNQDKLSIVVPKSSNAVQVMTVHQSKGLEFQAVIFPCDQDIYHQINPKLWLTELPKSYTTFSNLLLNANKDFALISNNANKLYQENREMLELDSLNILYVALTRPVEQLHIITDKNVTKSGEKLDYYSGLFISYLKTKNLWEEEKLVYKFGNYSRVSKTEKATRNSEIQELFISNGLPTNQINLLPSSSKYWDTEQGKAIGYGNKIHEILSKIRFSSEVNTTINRYIKQGHINSEEKKSILKQIRYIINHPELSIFFEENKYAIYNEKELYTSDEEKTYIPDRLMIRNQDVVIIDYKTGEQLKKHKFQIEKYGEQLEKIGFFVEKKILIYLGDKIILKEV